MYILATYKKDEGLRIRVYSSRSTVNSFVNRMRDNPGFIFDVYEIVDKSTHTRKTPLLATAKELVKIK